MSDVSGSWHPDPFGRYAQRYHDGTQWTEHVVDSSGAQSTDPPVATAAPAAAAPPTAGYGAPPAAGYGQPTFGAPAATAGGGTSLAIGPGLIVAAVGVLLVILSVFSLNWVTSDLGDGTLADVRDSSDALEQVDYEYGAVPKLYIDFGYLLGIVAAALAVVAAVNKNLSDKLKLPAIIAAAVFLALHVYAGFNANSQLSDASESEGGPTSSIAIGVYVGALGYIAAIVGAVLGPKPE